MAFEFKGTYNGTDRTLVLRKLGNSQTFAVGDLVEVYQNGVCTLASAATPVAGVIHSIVVGDNGIPPKSSTVVAGTATGSSLQSVTTDASNSDDYYAFIDVNQGSLYSAEVNGTLGTTNSSNLPGARIDVDSANTDYGRVLETTATRTVATTANFYSHGLDKEDSTRLIVSIASSELQSDANTEA